MMTSTLDLFRAGNGGAGNLNGMTELGLIFTRRALTEVPGHKTTHRFFQVPQILCGHCAMDWKLEKNLRND